MTIEIDAQANKKVDCVHYEFISIPEHGKHIIGICKRCGKVTDYTELQRDLRIINADRLTRKDVDMERILPSRKGTKKRKYKAEAALSAGRE